MQKRTSALLAALCLCLLLTACGGNDSISGEVVDIHQTPEATALILQTDGDKRIAVFLDEDTYVFGMDEIDGEAYKALPYAGVGIQFFPESRRTSLTTANGEKLKAYHADRYISIDAYLIQDAVTLSDGTVLDAWKTSMFGTTYRLRDGTELLREDAPSGPENHYVADLESFDDLSEAAKPVVRQYYDEQGALYDLQAELEKVWTEYQQAPEAFSALWVSQDTSPSASSERVMYFCTELMLPFDRDLGMSMDFCAAFDRETGAYIPPTDLFTCPAEDIAKNLLDLAERDGSGPTDPVIQKEMLAAFRPEFVVFTPDNVSIIFPPGTLPSHEYGSGYFVTVDYTAGLSDILQPWAIPQSSAK